MLINSCKGKTAEITVANPRSSEQFQRYQIQKSASPRPKQQCQKLSSSFSATTATQSRGKRKGNNYGPDIPRCGAGPRVSKSNGKERIRRKVIQRDGTVRYRGPRIKLGYLRNLMPHEPVFGTGEDPRGSPVVGTIFRPFPFHSVPAFIRFESSPRLARGLPSREKRNTHCRGSIPAIDRERRKRIVHVPRHESRTCLIEIKRWRKIKKLRRGLENDRN